jgi:peptide deformylase
MKQTILKSPDRRVRTVCTPVTEFDESLKDLVRDLSDTLAGAPRPGVGLSANQIGDLRRVFIIDESYKRVPPGPSLLKAFVNPQIRKTRGSQTAMESCLSLEVEDNCEVTRAEIINWTAQDLEGNVISGKMSKFEARIFQHELDHLDGKLIVDGVGS